MQLISSPASPFVRKVRVLLHETGLSDQVEELPVATTALATAPEAMAANPLGKIPALLREDGPAIYDSRVICRYLDARAGAGFYPEARLWEVLTLEATADGIMESGVLMVYEMRLRPEGARSAEWVEAQWAKIARRAGRSLDEPPRRATRHGADRGGLRAGLSRFPPRRARLAGRASGADGVA